VEITFKISVMFTDGAYSECTHGQSCVRKEVTDCCKKVSC